MQHWPVDTVCHMLEALFRCTSEAAVGTDNYDVHSLLLQWRCMGSADHSTIRPGLLSGVVPKIVGTYIRFCPTLIHMTYQIFPLYHGILYHTLTKTPDTDHS